MNAATDRMARWAVVAACIFFSAVGLVHFTQTGNELEIVFVLVLIGGAAWLVR